MSIFNRSIYDLIQREGNAGPGGAPTPPAPAQVPAPVPAAPPVPVPPQAPPQDFKALYEAEKVEHEKTRHEAAGYRVGNKGQIANALKTLGTAFGVEGPSPEEPITLENLAKMIVEDRTRREGENRDLRIDNELKDLYVKHGVDPKLTKAVLVSDRILEGLDPKDSDFAKQLNAAVKTLADQHAGLKVAGHAAPPVRTSAPMKGGGEGPIQYTRADLAGMTPEEINEARKSGQLDDMLGRNKK